MEIKNDWKRRSEGAFPIKILQGRAWETAFDITDTYVKAFTYKNSYSLTEQEKEGLISVLEVPEEKGSDEDKLIYFMTVRMMDRLGKNEQMQKGLEENGSFLFDSALRLILQKIFNLSYGGVDEESIAAFKELSASDKISKLQYMQPLVRNVILEIDKGITQIREEKEQEKKNINERTDNNGIAEGIHTSGEGAVKEIIRNDGHGGRHDRLRGQVDSGDLRGLGNRPRQWGLMWRMDGRRSIWSER